MCALGDAFYPSSMSWSEVAEPRPGRRPGWPRRRWGDGQLLGLLLLGFGVAALLRESGVFLIKWEAILAGLLIALGVGLVLTARSGRRVWPIIVGVVLILSLSARSPSLHFPLPTGSAIGDRAVLVRDAGQLAPSYNQGVGNLTVDLGQVTLDPATTKQVRIHEGIGQVRVVVPAGTGVELNVKIGIGHATVLGVPMGHGVGVRTRYQTPGYAGAERRISLQVNVGIGGLEVVEATSAGP